MEPRLVWARVFWGTLCRECPVWVARTDVSTGFRFPGYFM